MTDFKIGDVVRLKDDSFTRLDLIVRGLFTKVLHESDREAFCVSDCGQRILWAKFDQLELVNRPDPQADLKQAIREVLLSEEFMAAFAAAWMKTPLPYLHDVSFGNLKPGETLIGDYVWLGEPATEATNDPT